MKLLFFLLLVLNAHVLIAQTKKDTIVTVSIGLGIDRVKEKQEKINAFADSLNNYSGGVLPSFLLDECFDNQSNLWQGYHSPASLRWEVLEKVKNKKALRLILIKNDKRLKKNCDYDKGSNPKIEIPMIKKTFYQLIKKRYQQLK